MHAPEEMQASHQATAPQHTPEDKNMYAMEIAENCVSSSVHGLPVPGVAIPGKGEEGWWQRTKRIYAQEWKIRDTVFCPQSAMLGFGATTAALTGNLMGMGIATMPLAFAGIGWSAILFIFIFGALSAFNSLLLGWCCDILEERHEECRKFHWYTRYTDIATKAFGPWGGKTTVVLRLLSVVGLKALLLLTAAEFCGDVIGAFAPPLEIQGMFYCVTVAIFGIGFAITPMCSITRYWVSMWWLPSHLILVILLIAGRACTRSEPGLAPSSSSANHNAIFTIDLGQLFPVRQDPSPVATLTGGWTEPITGASFFASLGILAFNYANIAGFPLIRRDMEAPATFNKAALSSIAANTFSCLVVGAVAYSAVGARVNGNIVLSLGSAGVRMAANFFLMLACDSTFTLIHTTIDEHESVSDYGKRLVWGRLKRSFPIMLVACLLALAVPFKGPMMALVGALAVCPVIYVLPPIFYFKLCQKSDDWPERALSNVMKAALAASLFIGLLVALGGSFAAIAEIAWQSKATTQSCLRGFCYTEPFQLVPTPFILSDMIESAIKGVKLHVG
ncbi:uncharacterized protein LOC144141611 [Haemaphysalis longicornis]